MKTKQRFFEHEDTGSSVGEENHAGITVIPIVTPIIEEKTSKTIGHSQHLVRQEVVSAMTEDEAVEIAKRTLTQAGIPFEEKPATTQPAKIMDTSLIAKATDSDTPHLSQSLEDLPYIIIKSSQGIEVSSVAQWKALARRRKRYIFLTQKGCLRLIQTD